MTDEIKGHPAWQEILNAIPAEYHPLIKPKLQEWDKGVADKLASVRSEYEPYKEFIDAKIDPDDIKTGLGIMNGFQNDPAEIVAQAIETFNLGYVPQSELESLKSQVQNDLGEDDNGSNGGLDGGLEDDPRFKALMDTVDSLKSQLDDRATREQEQSEQEQLETTLKELEESEGSFDRLYVMALISQGVDATQAVKSYQDMINQAVEGKLTENGITAGNSESGTNTGATAPVVMNGAGDAGGSGVATQPVDLGTMSDGDVRSLVLEMIENSDAKS